MKIYDLKGYPVLSVVDEKLAKGNHQYNVNTASLASGSYLVVLVNGGHQVTKKIIINR